MFNYFKKIPFLYSYSTGIDITQTHIKIITLKKSGKNIEIENFQTHNLPDGVFKDGEIIEPQKIIDILKKIYKNIKGPVSSYGEIITSLPINQTFFLPITRHKNLENKKNTKEQIFNLIKNESEKYIPYDPDDLYYDWQIINENKIIFASAPKKIINLYTEMFEKAGIPLSAIDLKSVAIMRSILPFNNKLSNSKIIIFIGYSESYVIFGNASMIEIVLENNFTEKNIRETISKKLNLNYQDIEKAKQACGFNEKKCKGSFRKMIFPFLNDIFNQMTKAFIFREEKDFTNKIDEIILCGYAYKYKDIEKMFTNRFRTKVTFVDPLLNITTPKSLDKNLSQNYLKAIGLSLRGFIV